MLQFYCTHVPYPLWIWILKLNFLNSPIFEFYPLFLAPKQFSSSFNQPPVDLSHGQCLFNNIQWIVHLSRVWLLRLIGYLKFFNYDELIEKVFLLYVFCYTIIVNKIKNINENQQHYHHPGGLIHLEKIRNVARIDNQDLLH